MICSHARQPLPETTYRTRAQGPGWSKEKIRASLLSQAGGSIILAYEFACHDLAEMMKGGLLRPPPLDGPADVTIDKPKAIT